MWIFGLKNLSYVLTMFNRRSDFLRTAMMPNAGTTRLRTPAIMEAVFLPEI